jgi:hypothetical protein
MQTEKAIQLNKILKTSIEIFWAVYNQAKKKAIDKNEINQFISSFQEMDFDTYYDEFIEELKINIEEYKDIELVDNYLGSYFPTVDKLDTLEDSLNKDIIKRNFEVKFLLTARKKLEAELTKMWNIVYKDHQGGDHYSSELKRLFTEIMRKSNPDFELDTSAKDDEVEAIQFDNRFDFLKLKAECDVLDSKQKKNKLINERLIDFKQWQLLYDNAETDDDSLAYYYTNLYYPNFVKLCKSELDRIALYAEDAKVQVQVKTVVEPFKHEYCWNSSDTDLLELLAALYQHKSIQRKDGKALTRKELIDYFQTIFGMEIKDVEGKLTRATGRKINTTPFLDSLKIEFVSYAEEKEEKQRKRK